MANMLDETTGPIREEGRDVNVIDKQIPVKVGIGSTIFEIAPWVLFGLFLILGIVFFVIKLAIVGFVCEGLAVVGLIWGIAYFVQKMRARDYFRQLEQKIQSAASEIDNYLEQRVQILQNAAALVSKSVDLDKTTFTQIAAFRSGGAHIDDETRNIYQDSIDSAYANLKVAFENYPELKSHNTIADAMQQNSYLQKEITAARAHYNDIVFMWNRDINAWPVKMIVAARAGYTSRIPFSASKETKEAARAVFF